MHEADITRSDRKPGAHGNLVEIDGVEDRSWTVGTDACKAYITLNLLAALLLRLASRLRPFVALRTPRDAEETSARVFAIYV